ncbi:Rpn family recombination-promoting nuclease/putative transposase [Lachnospira eligens]|uniref:Rpn family recombination-promoting nuclease/putative transposase n=1 Tax=Lachnospira eligens TaxID=39485 RepID=UPI0018992FBB|nr:Rpn family recombination-promoting nuclease/putative transposase [Lachnospira eligens]
MAEKKDKVAVKYKDNVFCMLYRDKKNLLELYNALNDSNYTNVDDLEVTTLKDGSYMKYKNDASFVLNMSLYMFEQQSSKNENMPLRFLHYLSDVYREMFGNELLHRKTMMKIPVPYFVTFYNGKEKWDRDKLTLAEMFEKHVDNPQIDLQVKVIDINGDAEILNKCKSLRDYMTFVEKVRKKTDNEKINVREAVIQAIDECIEENILVDFFKEHREEIVEVSIYDYEEEKVRKTLADEAREEGLAEGIKEGIEKGIEKGIEEGEILTKINQIMKKVRKSKSLPTIASELEEEEADIKPIYDAVVASAPDYNIEEIKAKLNM